MGIFDFKVRGDLNDLMQVSSGHLLAASLDGGNSIVFQIPSPPAITKTPIQMDGHFDFKVRGDLNNQIQQASIEGCLFFCTITYSRFLQ